MIDRAAFKLATGIKRIVPDHPSSVAVLKYSLALLINAAAIIIISLMVALFTGRFIQAVTILISFAILRQVSGGVHLKSGTWCVIGTTALITLLSFIDLNLNWICILNAASFILAAVFAPSRIEKQSKIPKKFYPLLKVLSCLMICSNFIFLSPIIAASFFVQSLTLIKLRG